MKNMLWVLGVLLLSACGETFSERSENLAEAICSFERECDDDGVDYDDCYEDVVNDMEDAEAELDEEGEEACMKCMEVLIEEAEKAAEGECEADLDEDRIRDACGSSGEDGACAGYP